MKRAICISKSIQHLVVRFVVPGDGAIGEGAECVDKRDDVILRRACEVDMCIL